MRKMHSSRSTSSSPTMASPRPSADVAPPKSSPSPDPSPANRPGENTVSAAPKHKTRSSPALKPPVNYLRLVWEFLLVLAFLPFHFVLFALVPSKRWRRSWTLLEATMMPAVKRIMGAMDLCGFKISARETDKEPSRWWLRVRYGVEFEWVEGLRGEFVQGVVDDKEVQPAERVGMYNWRRKDASSSSAGHCEGDGLVGLFLHGGAYTHNSAHPGASSSSIPFKLFQKQPRFSSMHTAEYRLLPDYPVPAALQDAAAVYLSLLRRGVPGDQIVLLGDSSGGHLALALTRWINDIIATRKEQVVGQGWRLEQPAGLVLFSPWADPSHSFLGHTPETYVPRKNSCDYLFEVGAFRLHLVSSLLGSHPESFVKSPYMSPGAADVPPGTFTTFPPCFVHYGTGERCEEEGERLVRNLRRDGVRVEVVVTEDTPHDLLLLEMIWNKRQIEQIWDGAVGFLQTL
ncbi:hypothetical protein JCM10296v2_005979 [Rhodotorula toruloides]